MGDIDTNTLIRYFIIALIIILIIVCVVMIIKLLMGKEKFGSLERRQILSKAALNVRDLDESNLELQNDAEGFRRRKEGYAVSRTGLLFPGQFNHLLKNATDPVSVRQSDKKSVIQEIANDAKEQIKQAIGIQEPTAAEMVVEEQPIPSEVVPQEPQVEQEQLVQEEPEEIIVDVEPVPEKEYETEAAASEPEPIERDNVISNAGNSLESSQPENFGRSRIYNQFNNIVGSTMASQIAQAEKEEPTDINMKTFISKFTR